MSELSNSSAIREIQTMNSGRPREPQGHLNAKKRLEKKQKSLNVLLSDDEKAAILKILGQDTLDKKPKFFEKVVVRKELNRSLDSPRKQNSGKSNTSSDLLTKSMGRKNKKGNGSLFNLLSEKEMQSIMMLYKKTNVCKENEEMM